MNRLRSAVWLPLFDDLADPIVLARLASEAEETGWDGLFVWDHLVWREPIRHVADPWVALAAAASATQQLRLGPMVTPLPRRRPAKVARETVTLDRLSGGRLVLGVGIADDRFSGEPVRHRGEHYTVGGMAFWPRPVQRPTIPVWVAGSSGKPAPVRRAARHDGYFPLGLGDPDQVAASAARIVALRGDLDGYDLAVSGRCGVDPRPWAEAGATWWLTEVEPGAGLDAVRGLIRDGPPVDEPEEPHTTIEEQS